MSRTRRVSAKIDPLHESKRLDDVDEMMDWGFDATHCFRCGIHNSEIEGTLIQCGKCKMAYYCSMKCFNDDLMVHREYCQTGALGRQPRLSTYTHTPRAEDEPPKEESVYIQPAAVKQENIVNNKPKGVEKMRKVPNVTMPKRSTEVTDTEESESMNLSEHKDILELEESESESEKEEQQPKKVVAKPTEKKRAEKLKSRSPKAAEEINRGATIMEENDDDEKSIRVVPSQEKELFADGEDDDPENEAEREDKFDDSEDIATTLSRFNNSASVHDPSEGSAEDVFKEMTLKKSSDMGTVKPNFHRSIATEIWLHDDEDEDEEDVRCRVLRWMIEDCEEEGRARKLRSVFRSVESGDEERYQNLKIRFPDLLPKQPPFEPEVIMLRIVPEPKRKEYKWEKPSWVHSSPLKSTRKLRSQSVTGPLSDAEKARLSASCTDFRTGIKPPGIAEDSISELEPLANTDVPHSQSLRDFKTKPSWATNSPLDNARKKKVVFPPPNPAKIVSNTIEENGRTDPPPKPVWKNSRPLKQTGLLPGSPNKQSKAKSVPMSPVPASPVSHVRPGAPPAPKTMQPPASSPTSAKHATSSNSAVGWKSRASPVISKPTSSANVAVSKGRTMQQPPSPTISESKPSPPPVSPASAAQAKSILRTPVSPITPINPSAPSSFQENVMPDRDDATGAEESVDGSFGGPFGYGDDEIDNMMAEMGQPRMLSRSHREKLFNREDFIAKENARLAQLEAYKLAILNSLENCDPDGIEPVPGEKVGKKKKRSKNKTSGAGYMSQAGHMSMSALPF